MHVQLKYTDLTLVVRQPAFDHSAAGLLGRAICGRCGYCLDHLVDLMCPPAESTAEVVNFEWLLMADSCPSRRAALGCRFNRWKQHIG